MQITECVLLYSWSFTRILDVIQSALDSYTSVPYIHWQPSCQAEYASSAHIQDKTANIIVNAQPFNNNSNNLTFSCGIYLINNLPQMISNPWQSLSV